MKWLRPIVFSFISTALFYLLNNVIGQVPPLGKFLNPFAGFWQNNTSTDEILANHEIPGLHEEVKIVWDDRRVPHIFARNEHDLYLTQGYITARDRLWQMEFQVLGAAGRLSEIIGARTIEYDRFRRRIGMVYAAERGLEMVFANPEAKLSIESFSEGVNAWISGLNKKNLPIEYKILNYEPEEWTPLKSVLLLKMFAWQLTFRSRDRIMSRTRAALGEALMEKLYPTFPPVMDPIIPKESEWKFTPRKVEKPEIGFEPSVSQNIESSLNLLSAYQESAPVDGSNNWVVSGSKTKNGYPILCNDPHLGLSLPSVWYEIQLVSPDVNVYGITSPGAPGVIIGFNKNIAWGFTNANSDVLDWFEITFKDDSKREYLYGGDWRETSIRIEEIKVKNGSTIIDTVIYTHHGPIPYQKGEQPFDEQIPPGAAMRWIALDPSKEGLAIGKLNRAKNHDEFIEALSYYDGPAQNFIYADIHGNIAIRHNGKFPLRWRNQGKYISDGSDPAYDWQEFIPPDQVPQAKNPARGFLSSANQHPTDPSYPYYLGWSYGDYERGARINERLAQMQNISVQDMIDLQNDVVNIHARKLLPALLGHVLPDSLSPEERRVHDELKDWDYSYRSELIAPRIFDYWWFYLNRSIWEDDMNRENASLRWPSRTVTTDLILNDPGNRFFDDRNTEEVEALADLIIQSFRTACSELREDHGEFGDSWTLGKSRPTSLRHLGRIPGLGRSGLEANGSFNTINATTRTHGPSWRMIIELGPQVKAWGIYPGGQSGNPGSKFYDNMVDDWVDGRMSELLFLQSSGETNPRLIGATVLRGKE